jgi:tetratricopeptide (TPR) repeat protein
VGFGRPQAGLTPLAGSAKIPSMRRLTRLAAIAVFAILGAVRASLAQVPEQPPKPSNDDDWQYVTPGPEKCVEAGNVYLHRGALPGALSRFQEALKDDSHYAPAYLGLGKVYERMNQKQKALDAYRQYLDELPSAKDAAEATEVRRSIARLRRELKEK